MISMPNQDGPMGTSRIKAKWWFWCARYKARRRDFRGAFSYIERSQSLFSLWLSGQMVACGMG